MILLRIVMILPLLVAYLFGWMGIALSIPFVLFECYGPIIFFSIWTSYLDDQMAAVWDGN